MPLQTLRQGITMLRSSVTVHRLQKQVANGQFLERQLNLQLSNRQLTGRFNWRLNLTGVPETGHKSIGKTETTKEDQ